MSEQVLIRTQGGPLDGETRVVPVEQYGWPLPDRLPLDGGIYVKVSESQPPMPTASRVMRGAVYRWEPL